MKVFTDFYSQDISEKIQIVMLYVSMKSKHFDDVEISRWCNNKEYGYVFSLRKQEIALGEVEQINVLVYEHRHTEQVCWYAWNHLSFNEITCIENAGIPSDDLVNYELKSNTINNLLLPMANIVISKFEEFLK